MASAKKPGMNGNWKTVSKILAAVVLTGAAWGTVDKWAPWALAADLQAVSGDLQLLAQAQESDRRQGERREKRFGQMDERQRLLERQAAATEAVLTAIQRKLETMDKKLDARR